MFTITTELTHSDMVQVLKLARANYVELISKSVRPHGPTSSLCIAQVEAEVREYLRDALTGCYGLPVEAVLAKEALTGDVIGFAIVLGGHIPSDCGINYAAVHVDHRRQGILREMMNYVKSRHTHIGLSCNVDKVPFYEALGFRITGSDLVQVAMNWGVDKLGASMGVLDFRLNTDLNEAKETFLRINGPKAQGILSKMGHIQEQRIVYVQGYVDKRLSGLSHSDAL
ncbi:MULTISPECIES: GNAT family N-acetyltransferase [Pseudomonas]|nr:MULTISPECIES: GNAT family N-acetyltransferase [Pseudomonas]